MHDWTRPDPERPATSPQDPHRGQVVFGGTDDYSALGGHQSPPDPGRHEPAAWASAPHPPHPAAPQPAPPQPASAPAAPPARSRAPLVVGIAAGAVIVIGAFIAGGLLVPRWLAGGATETPGQSQEADATVEDAPEFAVDLSGTWDGTTGTGATKVNFVVTLVDDGTTLTGSIDYTDFGCTSSLTQTARDESSVTLHEKIESGPCSATVDTIVIDVPGEGATTASFTAGPRSGVITRR